jgi:hypothetical protein
MDGTITGIHFSISSSECSAVIDGTSATADNGMVQITYSDVTGKLKISAVGGNLHVYDVDGCLGAISNGDSATFSTIFTWKPQQDRTPTNIVGLPTTAGDNNPLTTPAFPGVLKWTKLPAWTKRQAPPGAPPPKVVGSGSMIQFTPPPGGWPPASTSPKAHTSTATIRR